MTETSPQHDRDVMTVRRGVRYSQPAMNELQHDRAFVIQLRRHQRRGPFWRTV